MPRVHAYCYRSGHISFGEKIPDGALPLMVRGPEKRVREFIEAKARHAYDGEEFLVPGIPEAPDDDAALEALQKFNAWPAKPTVKSLLRPCPAQGGHSIQTTLHSASCFTSTISTVVVLSRW